MDTITENYNWILCRDQEVLGSLVAEVTSAAQLRLPWLREHCRGGSGKTEKARLPGSLL